MRGAYAVFAVLTLAWMPACTLAPKYRRPEMPPPPAHRGAAPAQAATAGPTFGELPWDQVLTDPQIQILIRTALERNYDLRLAAARVLEARAQVTNARSFQFPTVDANAGYANLRLPRDGANPLPPGLNQERDFSFGSLDLSWELDFWGRLRNATAAARAQLLATEEARLVVVQTLVADMARAYFDLLSLDHQLATSKRSLEIRTESRRIVRLKVDRGISSEVEFRQADILVRTAEATIAGLEQQIEQRENQISLLLAQPPGLIARGRGLFEQELVMNVPEGLPSTLLERRPDIRGAEQALIAANANIGVARAAFFPRIALTASSGYESAALGNLLNGSNRTWTLGPAINLPLFNAGRIRAGVRAAEARRDQAVISYQLSVQSAFREVADALIGYRKQAEIRAVRENLVSTLRETVRLSDLRYRGGVTSYLEYLDSERQLLDAELSLAQTRSGELSSLVQVYRTLGGGWQQ